MSRAFLGLSWWYQTHIFSRFGMKSSYFKFLARCFKFCKRFQEHAYHGVSSLVSLGILSMCFLLESLPLRYCCLQTLYSFCFPQPTTFSVANHFKTTRYSDCTKSNFCSLPRWRSPTDAGYVDAQNIPFRSYLYTRSYLLSVRHLSLGGDISAMNNRYDMTTRDCLLGSQRKPQSFLFQGCCPLLWNQASYFSTSTRIHVCKFWL